MHVSSSTLHTKTTRGWMICRTQQQHRRKTREPLLVSRPTSSSYYAATMRYLLFSLTVGHLYPQGYVTSCARFGLISQPTLMLNRYALRILKVNLILLVLVHLNQKSQVHVKIRTKGTYHNLYVCMCIKPPPTMRAIASSSLLDHGRRSVTWPPTRVCIRRASSWLPSSRRSESPTPP